MARSALAAGGEAFDPGSAPASRATSARQSRVGGCNAGGARVTDVSDCAGAAAERVVRVAGVGDGLPRVVVSRCGVSADVVGTAGDACTGGGRIIACMAGRCADVPRKSGSVTGSVSQARPCSASTASAIQRVRRVTPPSRVGTNARVSNDGSEPAKRGSRDGIDGGDKGRHRRCVQPDGVSHSGTRTDAGQGSPRDWDIPHEKRRFEGSAVLWLRRRCDSDAAVARLGSASSAGTAYSPRAQRLRP